MFWRDSVIGQREYMDCVGVTLLLVNVSATYCVGLTQRLVSVGSSLLHCGLVGWLVCMLGVLV